jgi:hypothetical protein
MIYFHTTFHMSIYNDSFAIAIKLKAKYKFCTNAMLLSMSKLKLLYDWQSVLVSSTFVGLAPRNYFLSECCCLKFAVLYLWGALSDEKTGLQFSV